MIYCKQVIKDLHNQSALKKLGSVTISSIGLHLNQSKYARDMIAAKPSPSPTNPNVLRQSTVCK